MSTIIDRNVPQNRYFLLDRNRRISLFPHYFVLIVLAVLLVGLLSFPIYLAIGGIFNQVLYPKYSEWKDFPQTSISRAILYNSLENYTDTTITKINHKTSTTVKNFKLVCYYTLPQEKAWKQDSSWFLLPDDIDPNLCTHINVAFGTIVNNSIFLSNFQLDLVKKVINLKNKNNDLKVLLSIGGAGSESGFPEMVFNHTNRKRFIKSIDFYVKNLKFDGIDLDWEFPNKHPDKDKRQKIHFTQLLHEIRNEINRQDKHKFLLSVAVASPKFLVDLFYDVSYMNMFVDYVNLMTYDFHFYTTTTPFTGINAPLYSSPTDVGYFALLNINFSANYWHTLGMDKNKIVIGLPTYGHSFTLLNVNNNGLNAPSVGYGSLGSHGFVNYNDICWFINKNQIKPYFDLDSKSPYATKNTEWISYDDQTSLTFKAEYIKANNFGGSMIFSLNADDYNGVCKTNGKIKRFPLTNVVKTILSIKQL